MRIFTPKQFSLVFFISAAALLPAYADTIYNESASGDLSSNGLSPTALTVTPGSNEVFGTTGNTSGTPDRDYFTIDVPVGYQIGDVVELANTEAGGEVSFLGLEAGPQLTLPTNPSSAAGLLGWTHYGSVATDTDLIPALSTPSDGSSGFSSLPAGQYTFWIQDFNSGTFSYGFNVEITPTPEPSTYLTAFGALIGLVVFSRRKLKVSRQE